MKALQVTFRRKTNVIKPSSVDLQLCLQAGAALTSLITRHWKYKSGLTKQEHGLAKNGVDCCNVDCDLNDIIPDMTEGGARFSMFLLLTPPPPPHTLIQQMTAEEAMETCLVVDERSL